MKEKVLKNKNQRKCISCNKIGPKDDFIRIVKNKDGLISYTEFLAEIAPRC